MRAATLIRECQSLGINLAPNGDKLRVRPAERLTPELRARLLAAKAEVLAELAATPQPWDAAEALRLEAEMYQRVGAIYGAISPGHIPSAEWDSYEVPINSSLAAIRISKRQHDLARQVG